MRKGNAKPAPRKEIVRRVPQNESARQKFLRIGQYRMTQALHDIRLLGNLSNQGYEWETRDIDLMKEKLHEAIDAAFARFHVKVGRAELEENFRMIPQL